MCLRKTSCSSVINVPSGGRFVEKTVAFYTLLILLRNEFWFGQRMSDGEARTGGSRGSSGFRFLLLAAHCLLPTALCYLLTLSRGGEMADATDLKSVDRKVVWVRLPPSAPIQNQIVTGSRSMLTVCPFRNLVCL